MQSRGFTLFEVLVSLVILSVMLLCVTKFCQKDESVQIYYELQNIENSYIETKTIQSTQNIKFNNNKS